MILVGSKHYIFFENCIILFYSVHKQIYMLYLLCPHAGATSVYRKLITNRDPLDKSNQLLRKIMANQKIGHNSAIFLSRNKIHTSDLPQTGKINRVLWSEPFSLESIFNPNIRIHILRIEYKKLNGLWRTNSTIYIRLFPYFESYGWHHFIYSNHDVIFCKIQLYCKFG